MPKPLQFSWFDDIEPFLSAKFGDIRDVAIYKNKLAPVKYGTSHYAVSHETAWKHRNYPKLAEFEKDPLPNYAFNQAGMDYYNSVEGRKWFDAIEVAYDRAPDGYKEAKRLFPNLDFWNVVVIDIINVRNDSILSVDWNQVKSTLTPKDKWAEEIIDYILTKFPTQMQIEFCW